MTDREVSRLEWMGDGSWGSHHVSCCWILGTPDLGSSGSGRRRRFQTIWDQALHKWSRECNQSPQLLLGSVEAEENSAPTAPSVTQNTWVSASSGRNPSIRPSGPNINPIRSANYFMTWSYHRVLALSWGNPEYCFNAQIQTSFISKINLLHKVLKFFSSF